ncbi:MAG: phospholipid carrier-dependent glycosyltransferase [Deltaproteobacteria bacterium]|nr:phospholipid carrier-dependent glycosyltransferase [Deltaproteobacteria bacterium]
MRLATYLALACALGAITAYLLGLGGTFGNTDEVLYAEFIRRMLDTGSYFALEYDGAPVLQRPALPVALYALAAKVIPGELGLRIMPSLLTALSGAAAMWIAWRAKRRPGVGVVALCLVTGAPTVYCYGRALLSDPPLVLACTLAMGATMAAMTQPRYVAWALVALGGAVAMKSLAAAIPAVGLVPWLLWAAWRGRRSKELHLGWGIAGFLALALPFFLVNLARHGAKFVDVHLGYNLAQRARGAMEGIGIGGPLAYVEHMWRFDGPVVTLVLLGGVALALVVAMAKRDWELAVPSSSALGTLLLLSAIGTRLPHYLLVFYPPAAVSVALLAARIDALASNLRSAKVIAPVLAVTLLLTTLASPTVDTSLIASPEAKSLGQAAAERTPRGSAVYTLDWYAPAYAYYANRPWRLLSTVDKMVRVVGGVDVFRDAGTVSRVPPWPSGELLVAAERARIAMIPGLRIIAEIASAGDYVLAQVVAE